MSRQNNNGAESVAITIDTTDDTGHEKNKMMNNNNWMREDTDFLMVVTTFIATVAFQIGTNPPGGVWQEDDKQGKYFAGKSIMATKSPSDFIGFLVTITACFVFSAMQFAVLFLKKWPVGAKNWSFSRFILYSTMGLAVSSMGFAYGCSVRAYTPDSEENTLFVISFITMLGFPISLAAISIYLQYFSKSSSS
ncbi:uncharacterized protein LOC105435852 [Cucumis sativus]|uniref:PGG domain-containing protein n=1 Tax=Cucumis sativus TaxID=3659 RepID=A0A0A0KGU1_CUCSA|nr:uncharacterized protein LOC105435852 [Cucumis sativus]KGN47597.1 hypothetical protein Csa_019050 [Cucumis sativus]